ncbi:MaoC family dehydratase [Pelagibacterium limicola]|uniref:MaoC family dehydratase n=1 Tax=Pelagibacterium limicola TaxID=2791022 RepID=UPI0018B003DF|nr:MaoC family dehydratase [Pelagibacterium limicola]
MTGARTFEDFIVGETWTSASVELTEAEIIAFARANDPQPMHTDPEAAKDGRFGGLIASGWQIAALSMRLFIDTGGYGATPVVGMGIDELRWKKPVRPGDRLHVVREVIDTQLSRSNPKYGVIRTRVSVINQDGETVMSLISMGQVPVRSGSLCSL